MEVEFDRQVADYSPNLLQFFTKQQRRRYSRESGRQGGQSTEKPKRYPESICQNPKLSDAAYKNEVEEGTSLTRRNEKLPSAEDSTPRTIVIASFKLAT